MMPFRGPMAIDGLASMLTFKRIPCLVCLTLAITACLMSVAGNTLAQDAKTPAQEQSAPVPSIEELKLQLEAKQQPEARQKQPKLPPADREPAAAPESPRTPASPAVLAKSTPIPKNISPVKLEPNSAAVSDSCPYPVAARNRGETGTV